MLKTYVNATNTPILIDDEGRTLGGGETTETESTFDGVKRAVKEGWLIEIKEVGEDDDKPASKSVSKSKEDDKPQAKKTD